MSEFVSQSSPEFGLEPKIDRDLAVGRLNELGVDEDLDYLLDESEFDDNDLLGEIVTLATMYDLDMDDVLPETTPVEYRTKGELGEPYSDEV